MISSTTSLDAISKVIESSTQENIELDAKIQNKTKSLLLVSNFFLQVGGAIMSLEKDLSHLKSSNETLEKEITELKMNHVTEWESFLDNEQVAINLIATQINVIVKRFDLYQINPDFTLNFNISKSDVELFKNLEQAILKCNRQGIKVYPPYVENTYTINLMIQERSCDLSVTAANSLVKTNPELKDLITNSIQQYETLKSKVEPLKNTLDSLIAKKERRIQFHSQYMEKIKKEKHSFIKVLELVKTAFNTIQWSKLLTVTTFNRYAQCEGFLYEDQLYFSNEEQQKLKITADKKVNKIKGQMQLIISNLEATIKSDVSKKGTKS